MRTLASAADRMSLLERMNRLESVRTPLWGRMSAPQMICHLGDAFRMALGTKATRPRVTLMGRTVVKGIALYLPLAWPAGIPTSRELDQAQGGGTPPGDFGADLALARELLEAVAAAPPGLAGRIHPVFGVLSQAAWLRWAYLHTDHHLRQFGV